MSKTIKKTVHSSKYIQASVATIFKIISDHEGTPNWVQDVKVVKVLKHGTVKNGKGTIRSVTFRPVMWSTIQEEIIEFNPNQDYSYRITEGMPGLVSHLGHWILEPSNDGMTKVIWDVSFEFKRMHWFRLFVGNFAKTFKKIQEKALNSLDNYAQKQEQMSA